MRLFQKFIERLRKQRAAQPKAAGASRNRLRFESLELREMFSGSSGPTPPPSVLSTPVLNFVDNTTTNATGTLAYQPNQIHIAVYGQQYETGQWYYLDKSGTPHLTTSAPGGDIPTFLMSSLLPSSSADQFALSLPETLPGSSYGLQSARAYVSMGTTAANALTLTVNPNGTVNGPAANNSFYDFFEFTMNAPANPFGNLNIDTTNVDQFGIPMTITVASNDPSYTPTTVGAATNRASIVSQYQTFSAGTPYAASIDPNSDPTYGTYRIQNPSDVLNAFQSQQELLQTQTLLPYAISASATSVQVFFAGAFPNPATTPFQVQIGSEVMNVTAAALQTDGSTIWTVVRGQNSTTAASHAAGTFVSIVGNAVSATQTKITVPGTTGFPTTTPFLIQVGTETMQVTAAKVNRDATTTWTVVRGFDGTTAAAYPENQLVTYNPMNQSGLNSIFNSAIDALFTQYENAAPLDQLLLKVTANSVTNYYTGDVIQDPTTNLWELQFTNTTNANDVYNIYYPFFNQNAYEYAGYTPQLSVGNAPTSEINAAVTTLSPTQMVFNCNGVFADNTDRTSESLGQQTVLANLENQVVSALNRGVALLPGYSSAGAAGTWADPTEYYNNVENTTGQAWNQYAQFLHQSTVSLGGKNYGFAFDDQGGNASDIAVSTFTSATVTFAPWANNPSVGISMRSLLSSSFPASPPVVPHSSPAPPNVTPQVTPPVQSNPSTPAPNTANAPFSLRNFLASGH